MDANITSWHSYPSIYAIGHKYLTELFLDNVLIEEKLDGSQFSFGLFEDGLKIRSKGVQMDPECPEKMFNKAVEWVKENQNILRIGWTYRGEFFQKPQHNTIPYDRVPKNWIAIFDINTGHETYLNHHEKRIEAERIGLEVVPVIYQGRLSDVEGLQRLLDKDSFLGGAKIEGIVVKNYSRFGPDKKALMGKYVSEAFKETHKTKWKKDNPGLSDIKQVLIDKYRNSMRWSKAVQHLKEAGKLDQSPKDIPLLIKEAKEDIQKECSEEIKDILFNWAIGHVLRGSVGGLPEWYKQELLKEQFFSNPMNNQIERI